VKGVLFNVVEDVVVDAFGADTWDDLLDAAGLDGAYTSLGNYDDDDLAAIVSAAGDALSLTRAEVLRFVGREAFARLAARYPDYPNDLGSSRALLHRLDDVIHPQVLNLYPGAHPPAFEAIDRDGDEMLLVYRSSRQLCHLAEGLVFGAAAAYGEVVDVSQAQCVLDGADECHLVVRYGEIASSLEE
jgi:hypothetical protein